MDKDLKKVVVLLAHPNMENSQANKVAQLVRALH